MQVKVFRAKNMQDALRQVKEVFGRDALILSTRTVRKNRLGFLRAPELEVTAARENKTRSTQGRRETKFCQELETQVSGLSNSLGVTYDQSGRLGLKAEQHADTKASAPAGSQDRDIKILRNEIREIRHLLTKNAHGGRTMAGDTDAPFSPEVQFLVHKGLSREVAEAVVEAKEGHGPQGPSEESSLEFRCQECLAQWVQVANGITNQKNRGRRVAFLGPTGVGKTTTLAKLAAHYLQKQGRDILLVTIDNYRIAAAEQLQIYAQIMNLPLEIVSTPEQLNTVLRRQGVNKLTLIDTAGRNPRDEQSLQELEAFLGQGLGIDKHLVLSATTREEDLQGIAKRFSPLGLDGLVFTKMDETRHYASLVNVQYQTGCPLSYLTDGQRVPEDLHPADPESLSRIIINLDEKSLHDNQADHSSLG
ncbi:MAG: flagellar biosynthesis protein FlhF [Desulfovermiculus sp.]